MSAYTKDNKVTHAGVAVNNWAGDFDCSVCHRKRLTASEFSKKMQEKKRRGEGGLKCKPCVEKAAQAERDAAAAAARRELLFAERAAAAARDREAAQELEGGWLDIPVPSRLICRSSRKGRPLFWPLPGVPRRAARPPPPWLKLCVLPLGGAAVEPTGRLREP